MRGPADEGCQGRFGSNAGSVAVRGWVWAAAAKPSVDESQVTWQLMVMLRKTHSRVSAWRLRALE
jgi:hypothetical protein